MIVTKLILNNYRSYEHSEIDLEEVFVVEPGDLTNPNDCGKTHIFRALKMILFHEPFPDTHLRYNQKNGYVEIHLANGYKIRRSWEGKDHFTYITDPKQEVIKFKGTNDSSTLVKNITGFTKIKLEEKDTTGIDFNFISTKKTPPLLEERGDTILKKLSLIMGCQQIEEATSVFSSELTKVNAQIDKIEKSINSSSETLKQKEDLLTTIDKEIFKVETLENLLLEEERKEQIALRLSTFSKKVSILEGIPDLLSTISSNIEKTKLSVNLGKKALSLNTKYVELTKTLITIEQEKTIVNETLIKLEEIKKNILKELGVCPTCGTTQ